MDSLESLNEVKRPRNDLYQQADLTFGLPNPIVNLASPTTYVMNEASESFSQLSIRTHDDESLVKSKHCLIPSGKTLTNHSKSTFPLAVSENVCVDESIGAMELSLQSCLSTDVDDSFDKNRYLDLNHDLSTFSTNTQGENVGDVQVSPIAFIRNENKHSLSLNYSQMRTHNSNNNNNNNNIYARQHNALMSDDVHSSASSMKKLINNKGNQEDDDNNDLYTITINASDEEFNLSTVSVDSHHTNTHRHARIDVNTDEKQDDNNDDNNDNDNEMDISFTHKIKFNNNNNDTVTIITDIASDNDDDVVVTVDASINDSAIYPDINSLLSRSPSMSLSPAHTHTIDVDTDSPMTCGFVGMVSLSSVKSSTEAHTHTQSLGNVDKNMADTMLLTMNNDETTVNDNDNSVVANNSNNNNDNNNNNNDCDIGDSDVNMSTETLNASSSSLDVTVSTLAGASYVDKHTHTQQQSITTTTTTATTAAVVDLVRPVGYDPAVHNSLYPHPYLSYFQGVCDHPQTVNGIQVIRMLTSLKQDEEMHVYTVSDSPMMKYRRSVVDWLSEFCVEFKLQPITIHLAIRYYDLVIARARMEKNSLQCVAIACVLIACKFQECSRRIPSVKLMCECGGDVFSPQHVIKMEALVLDILEWRVWYPTPVNFLDLVLRCGVVFNSDLVNFEKPTYRTIKHINEYVTFFSELYAQETEMLNFKPSIIAASIIACSRRAIRMSPIWSHYLTRTTGYTEIDISDCYQTLYAFYLDSFPDVANAASPQCVEDFERAVEKQQVKNNIMK